MGLRIKKGDRVRVRTGAYRGRTERVLEMICDSTGQPVKAVVEHVNMVKRHTRATRTSSGGIVEKEAPINISNLMLVDAKSDESTRFGAGRDDAGRKIRISKRSGDPI